MKKVLCFAIALLLLMLTACTAPEQPTEPTQPPTEPTTPPTVEPTVPPEEPDQPDLSWRPEQTEKLSSEEYFAKDRPYYKSSFWLSEKEGITKGYTLNFSETGLQVCTYDANPWDYVDGVTVYEVPNSENLLDYELIGTNGLVACFLERNDVMAGIFLVDLVSGERTSIVQNTIITDALFSDDVIFYAAFVGYQMQIVRYYIPTGEALMIPTGQTIPALFSFYLPDSTHGTITWTGISDAVTERLVAELDNPDSKYKQHPDYEGMDFSFLWKNNQSMVNGNPIVWYWICYFIQQDTGLDPILHCQHDPVTAQNTQRTSIIDNCWFGSGYPHNHFEPEAPAPSKPVSNIGAWQPFVETMAETEPETLNPYLESYRGYYYQVTGDEFMQLADIPLHSCWLDPSEQAYYAITQDDTLIRIYTDGTAPTVLYQGQNDIWKVSYEGTMICLGDGDTIVELDLETQQWRTVFTHEDLSWFYCDYENENVLYIELVSGLHIESYLYDLSTGKLIETNYRL